MTGFVIRFFICNVFIAVFLGIILAAKQILKQHLSPRLQYNLWFLMAVLLVIPFLPIQPIGFGHLFSWFSGMNTAASGAVSAGHTATTASYSSSVSWMKDFSVSVSRNAPPLLCILPLLLWLAGALFMLFSAVKSRLRLCRLKSSALPLQNREVQKLYEACRQEMKLKSNIPVYSSAFLSSPISVGLFRPRIYIPIRLVSNFDPAAMRYMLLHELQHGRHMDALANTFMNLANIIYWFHPVVRYAVREMRTEREIACDASVLQLLPEEEYAAYGHTLINFAEKISRSPFPFAAGIGGDMPQIKRRILNIVSYRPATPSQKIRGISVYVLIVILLLGFSPVLSIYAGNSNGKEDVYRLKEEKEKTAGLNLDSYFEGYNGCFVLYDLRLDSWQIYNKALAEKRVSPDSTFKIYSALAALERQLITPASSALKWNGQEYPFPEWNQDHSLASAMQNSVNWYFQSLDQQLGSKALEQFYTEIGYGNHDLSGQISGYWMESSLKISPLEQVKLLKEIYSDKNDFKPENIQAVKQAMLLSSAEQGTLYGKTGTGTVNGQNINGWFIGFVESADNSYFFAVNIQGNSGAEGSAAGRIALNILKDRNIYGSQFVTQEDKKKES